MWNNQQQQYPPPNTGGYAPPPSNQWSGAPMGGYGGPPPPVPPHQQAYGGDAGYQNYAPQQGYGQNQSYGSQMPYQHQPQQQYQPPVQGGFQQQQQHQGGYQQPQPPLQQQQQFTMPNPMGQPLFLGVPLPPENPAPGAMAGYNAQFDAERIRKATKGFGTDEKVIIDTMAPLDAFQMDALTRTYEQTVGRTLVKTLEKELSSWLEYTLVLLSRGPLLGDVHLIHRACKGMGTHEDLLNEVLLCRTNEEIRIMKYMYRKEFNKDLDATVRGELSMKTERLFNMVLAAGRDESTYADPQGVQNDVQTLYRGGQGKVGTIAICGILASRSDAQLRAIAQAFPMAHRKSLSDMIQSEFSGHMRDALLHIARRYENDGDGVQRDAELLEAAMEGMGTKDERLCYRLVRMHWNKPRFNAVKQAYHARYGKPLRRRVEGETTGKYEKALVAIIEMN